MYTGVFMMGFTVHYGMEYVRRYMLSTYQICRCRCFFLMFHFLCMQVCNNIQCIKYYRVWTCSVHILESNDFRQVCVVHGRASHQKFHLNILTIHTLIYVFIHTHANTCKKTDGKGGGIEPNKEVCSIFLSVSFSCFLFLSLSVSSVLYLSLLPSYSSLSLLFLCPSYMSLYLFVPQHNCLFLNTFVYIVSLYLPYSWSGATLCFTVSSCHSLCTGLSMICTSMRVNIHLCNNNAWLSLQAHMYVSAMYTRTKTLTSLACMSADKCYHASHSTVALQDEDVQILAQLPTRQQVSIHHKWNEDIQYIYTCIAFEFGSSTCTVTSQYWS